MQDLQEIILPEGAELFTTDAIYMLTKIGTDTDICDMEEIINSINPLNFQKDLLSYHEQ
jgi:hypothetical protein